MPHLQAYAALWLIIQMALGRERPIQGASGPSHLPVEGGRKYYRLPQVTLSHFLLNKGFVIHFWLEKIQKQISCNINTAVCKGKEEGSAPTALGGAVNKPLCHKIDRLL